MRLRVIVDVALIDGPEQDNDCVRYAIWDEIEAKLYSVLVKDGNNDYPSDYRTTVESIWWADENETKH